MNHTPLALLSTGLLLGSLCQAAVLYHEEFDGNTNGYNPDSTTALVGDNDWVDFLNRIASDSYTTASGGTETVLAGTTNASNDPQVRSDFGFGIPKDDITSFVIRLRVDKDGLNGFDDSLADADFDVRMGTIQYGNPGATNVAITNLDSIGTLSLVAESDGWHVATWTGLDVSGFAQPTLEAIRIEPTNGAGLSTASWEIDYFTINGVPEPASAGLLALGLGGLALGRRRG